MHGVPLRVRSKLLACALLIAGTVTAHAQWEIQTSPTTVNLRGIDFVGGGIAWASGAEGTVLHTKDGGNIWEICATPRNGEHLDFRGVQALDENTAIVMSSGKGNLSRIYKTTDGCKTWKLAFENPDDTGFFDSLLRITTKQLYLLGDPVSGRFAMFLSQDGGDHWVATNDPGLGAASGEGAFAASNSSLTMQTALLFFGTGGTNPTHVYYTYPKCDPAAPNGPCAMAWTKSDVPLAAGTPASGVFSIASRVQMTMAGNLSAVVVAVGGIYDKPEVAAGTAAFSRDGGTTWKSAQIPPAGYRSAVAYDKSARTWITVGPNGTDLSADDGKTWHPLKPAAHDAAASDQNWNALSLPFAVGAHGRIGKLRMEDQPQ